MSLKETFNKINNKHFLSLSGNFTIALLSLVIYGIIFRKLTREQTGEWVFFQFVFMLLDTMRTGYLQPALLKYCPGLGKRTERFAGSGWIIALIITMMMMLVNLAAIYYFNYFEDIGYNIVLRYVGLGLLFILPMNYSIWMLQASDKYDSILMVRIISHGSFILFITILLILNSLNLNSIVFAYLLSIGLTSIICVFSGFTHITSTKLAGLKHIRLLMNYGKYGSGTLVLSNLIRSSDGIIIKIFLGPEALAVYNIPQKLIEIVEIPLRNFSLNALPEMTARFNLKQFDDIIVIMKRYAGLLTILFLPICILSLIGANLAIWLLGGSGYLFSEAPGIFRTFMIISLLLPLDRFIGITLDVIEKRRYNFYKVGSMLVINIIGNVAAILIFKNLYAIAAVSVLTFSTGIIIGHYLLNTQIPHKLGNVIKIGISEFKLFWKP